MEAPDDFDLATNALPDEMRSVFQDLFHRAKFGYSNCFKGEEQKEIKR
jgi:tRNA nucleotidyltransferase/poly(A) polymerase